MEKKQQQDNTLPRKKSGRGPVGGPVCRPKGGLVSRPKGGPVRRPMGGPVRGLHRVVKRKHQRKLVPQAGPQVTIKKKGWPVKVLKQQQLPVVRQPVAPVTQPSRSPQVTVTITKRKRPLKVLKQQVVRQPVAPEVQPPVQPSKTALDTINTWLVVLIQTRDGPEASHPAVLQYC